MKLTKNGRERDFQRQRVYDAEHHLGGIFKSQKGGRLETVPEIEAWVGKILRSAWTKGRWPNLVEIEIKDGRGTQKGLAWTYLRIRGSTGVLSLPRWARSRLIILHELAHCVTDVEYGKRVSVHGPEFCSNYLALVGRWLDEDTKRQLQDSFKEHNVKFRKRPDDSISVPLRKNSIPAIQELLVIGR